MAMYLKVCVLSILCVSALGMLNPSFFHYGRSPTRRSDDCNICYGGECLPLDQSRCEFYVEADTMLLKDDEEPEGFMNPQLKNDVDSIIYDMIEKADQTSDLECIPFMSRYTDCNKENVCTGCKTCHCDADGNWNCTVASRCRSQNPAIDIDHRVLIKAMENLIENIKSVREKRSVTDNPLENNSSSVTIDQISEWLFGDRSMYDLNFDDAPTTESTVVEENTFTSALSEIALDTSNPTEESAKPTKTEPPANTDPDYLAFDEVLSNIAVDNKNYTRRKPLLDIEPNNKHALDAYSDNKTYDFDYMLLDDDKPLSNDTAENVTEISYMVNFVPEEDGVSETPQDDATKIVIDLLEHARKDEIFNETDYMEIGTSKDDLFAVGFDNTNDILDYNALNIMKRDISDATPTANASNTTSNNLEIKIINIAESATTPPSSDIKTSLKQSVLLPLIKVINSRRDELYDLSKIKQNLINFMNVNNQSPVVEIIDYPNVSDTNVLHDIEMFPELGYDLRRANPNLMEKFLFKLKSDINEVIKDILGLQKYRQGSLPSDLNLLIHALKRYVNRNKPYKKKLKTKMARHFRRSWDTSKCIDATFRNCMVEILRTIDKDMPKDNAIAPLSTATKKIMRHVVRTYYTDEFSTIGLRVHDPNYNMTNDLKIIGNKWLEMTNSVIGSSPFVTLYRMKLLHFYLESDITKMTDALALIDFARSRRMVPYFKSVQSNVIDDINKGLSSIHNKVQIIVQYYANNPNKDEAIDARDIKLHASNDDISTTAAVIAQEIKDHRQQKKHSFIKHIRNLLKSSKRDINDLLRRQVPKSEIVKQLAKKKLDEIAQKRYNEYEDTMKRWQKNLGVMPRFKRSSIDELSGRIKNIIPKYLRHKVKPKLHEQKKNATPEKQKGKKKKHGHHKKTTLTTAVTPKTKTTRKTISVKKTPKTTTSTTPKYQTSRITIKPNVTIRSSPNLITNGTAKIKP